MLIFYLKVIAFSFAIDYTEKCKAKLKSTEVKAFRTTVKNSKDEQQVLE